MMSITWRDLYASLAKRSGRTPAEVLHELDVFLSTQALEGHERGEALSLRGDVMISLGRRDEARECFNEALSLSDEGTYARYALWLVLADLEQDPMLCLNALKTALHHGALPCASALWRLYRHSQFDRLDATSRRIVTDAIDMCCRSLRLENIPSASTEEAIVQIYRKEFGSGPEDEN